MLIWLQCDYGVNDTQNDFYQQSAVTVLLNSDGCCTFQVSALKSGFLGFFLPAT